MPYAVAATLLRVVEPWVADQTPDAEDVTAGPWGAVVLGLLVVATVILMRSFLKQMRKTDEAKRAGVFGDPPAEEDSEPPPGDEAQSRDRGLP